MDSIDITFTGTVTKDETSGWTCVQWPDSVAALGTGKTVKVNCTVDDQPLEVTLMPSGTGCHFVPLKAATRKLLKKDIGDTVKVCIQSKR
jgi:hypothetical protein